MERLPGAPDLREGFLQGGVVFFCAFCEGAVGGRLSRGGGKGQFFGLGARGFFRDFPFEIKLRVSAGGEIFES